MALYLGNNEVSAESGIPPAVTADDIKSALGYTPAKATDVPTNVVKYTSQSLTAAQKTQARTNIGAGLPLYVITATQQGGSFGTVDLDKTTAEMEAAYQAGYQIICRLPAMPFTPLPLDLPLLSRVATKQFAFGMATCLVNGGIIAVMLSVDSDAGAKTYFISSDDRYYTKSASGIPKTDLAEDVQTSLDKADSAVQTLPEALKNPNALTFTGAVTDSYDGSAAKTVNIPTVPTSLKNPYALSITEGGTSKTYDGSAAQSITIPPVVSGAVVLPASGTALADNTVYIVPIAVTTYAFTPPTASHGWAHGIFSVGNSPSITFTGKILGKLPTFESGKQYEFDVFNKIWIVQEVVTQ